MIQSSLWSKLLPLLGLGLAAALLAAGGAVWWNGDGAAGDGGLGELVAITQAARTEARGALSGQAAAFEALTASRAAIASLRGALASDTAASDGARRLAADPALWQRIDTNLAGLLESRDALAGLDAARQEALDLAPELLLAVSNVASVLPPADLAANQPSLARFEGTVEAMQENVRSLGAGGEIVDAVRRIGDAEQYLGQFVRGLRGEDDALGVVPVRDRAAQADLVAIDRLLGRARSAIAAIGVRRCTPSSATPSKRPARGS